MSEKVDNRRKSGVSEKHDSMCVPACIVGCEDYQSTVYGVNVASIGGDTVFDVSCQLSADGDSDSPRWSLTPDSCLRGLRYVRSGRSSPEYVVGAANGWNSNYAWLC